MAGNPATTPPATVFRKSSRPFMRNVLLRCIAESRSLLPSHLRLQGDNPPPTPPATVFRKSSRPFMRNVLLRCIAESRSLLPSHLRLQGDHPPPETASDLPERRAGRAGVGPAPVRMVQCVLGFEADFQIRLLVQPDPLDPGHVEDLEAGVANTSQQWREALVVTGELLRRNGVEAGCGIEILLYRSLGFRQRDVVQVARKENVAKAHW